ncbi:MAG: HAD hydrolase-like protein [Myxococcota bacterium]
MPAPPALVLFDLDGTLTDSAEGIVKSLTHAFRALGDPAPAESILRGEIGTTLPDVFARHLAEPSEPRIARAIDAYRERFDRVGWQENRVYDGIPAQLAQLRAQGVRTVVATSKPATFAERIVAHFDLDPHFDRVYGSTLDGRLADKAELLAHILAEQGQGARHCVMVGDRHHDVRGAHAVGARMVGVLWGYGSRDELEDAGADELCPRVDELAALVSGPRVGS